MEAQETLILSGRYVGFLPGHRGGVWQALERMRPVKANDWSFTSRLFVVHDPRREGELLRRAFVECLRGQQRIGVE